jgi:hypothetical protein
VVEALKVEVARELAAAAIALAKLVQKVYPFPEEGVTVVQGRNAFIAACAGKLFPDNTDKQNDFVERVSGELFFPVRNGLTRVSPKTLNLLGNPPVIVED